MMHMLKKFYLTVLFLIGVFSALCGFFGEWHWSLDLFSHFRPQEAAFLLFVILSLIVGGHPKKAALASLVLALCLVSFQPYIPMIGQQPPLKKPGDKIRIFYANVYTPNREYDRVISQIKKENPDMVLLVEIDKSWAQKLTEALPEFPVHESVPRDDNFGIMFFSKTPMKSVKTEYLVTDTIPAFQCVFERGGKEIVFWLLHTMPPLGSNDWGLRNAELAILSKKIGNEKRPTFVAGDINTSPWSYWFNVVKDDRLDDTAKGYGFQLTWPSWAPLFLRISLDHLFASKEFYVYESRVLGPIGSDHYPVLTTLGI